MSSSMRKSPFVDLLLKWGMSVSNQSPTWNMLNVDQRTFQSNLKRFLQKTDNPRNKNYENFKEFIESYLDDETNFLVSLLPTKNNTDAVLSHSSNQDSLIKLLIEIDQLQSDLFDYLIMKTINYCETSNDTATTDRQILGLTLNVPTHIINHFRYQPKILEPESLCQKLIQLISSLSSNSIIKEIILCFPDILSDSSHDGLITDLEDLLKNSDLISPTLETLSNLKFHPKNTQRIVNYLFDKYEFINENDLPVLIKFFLKSTLTLNSTHVLNKLRLVLKFDHIQSENVRFLIYDVFREYFQISTQLIDLYLSLLNDALNTSNENVSFTLRPIDFLIVTIIYSLPQQLKQIDKLLKQVLNSDEVSVESLERLVKFLFKHCGSVMKDLFGSICVMSKSLITSLNTKVSSMAQIIYKVGFGFLDAKLKQSLINLMIESVVCTNGAARDNCLEVLMQLSANDDGALGQFSLQIKTLLDYVEYFSLAQIRKIYFVICSVTYSSYVSKSSTRIMSKSCLDNSLASNSLQDYLTILINKQLSSNELRYKQIGVIGALMMVKNMAIRAKKLTEDEDEMENDESLNVTSASILISGLNTEIRNIWQMILESSRSSPESLGLFEDDLSCLLRKESLPESIETLIKENLREMTRDLFKLDLVYQKKLAFCKNKLASFKIGFEFGIDDHAKGALNLIPQLMNDLQKKNATLLNDAHQNADNKLASSVNLPTMTIASTFRLMASLERQNIRELNDYLGIPILSIKKDELYKYGNMFDQSAGNNAWLNKFKHNLSDEERRIVCDSLFYVINWLIELVNAFAPLVTSKAYDETCSDEENELNKKILSRLNTVHELQMVVLNLLPNMSCYKPPMAVFGLVDSASDDWPYVHTLFKKKENRKKKPVKLAAGNKKRKSQSSLGKKMTKKKKVKSSQENEDVSRNEEEEDVDEESNENEEDVFEEEKELVDDTDLDSADDVNDTSDLIDLEKISIYFREFDLCLINLINFPLEINQIIPDSTKFTASKPFENWLKLKPATLSYILTDVNKKLSLFLKSPSANTKLFNNTAPKKPSKLQLYLQLNPSQPTQFVRQLVHDCLDNICNHLDTIHKHVKEIQAKNDNIKDPSELCNNPKNVCLLKSFNQLLKTVQLIFLWLNSETRLNLIEEVVKKIGKKEARSCVGTQVEKVPEIYCYKYFTKFSEIILEPNTAECLAQILDILCNKIFAKMPKFAESYSKKCRLILIDICDQFLKAEFNLKLALFNKSQSHHEAIVNIFNILLSNDENSLALIERFVELMCSESFAGDRDNCGGYETLKTHFSCYFKACIEYTVSGVKALARFDSKRLDVKQSKLSDVVVEMRRLVHMHFSLVCLKKSKEREFRDVNVLTVLKNCKLFLNNFLKYAMPWMDQAFEEYRDQVVGILEQLQRCIQFMQEICVTKVQSSVARQTPVFMRCAEAFLLRVKQLLYVNRCDDALNVDLNKLTKPVKASKRRAKPETKVLKEKNKNEEAEEEEDDEEGDDDNDNDEDGSEEEENSGVDSD